MKDMLCLTVYEAKGLEFTDVILFNFFKDSKCENQWKLLNDIWIQQKRVKIESVAKFVDFEQLDIEEATAEQQPIQEGTQINTMSDDRIESQKIQTEDTEITTILRLKESRVQVYRKFA